MQTLIDPNFEANMVLVTIYKCIKSVFGREHIIQINNPNTILKKTSVSPNGSAFPAQLKGWGVVNEIKFQTL